MPASVKRNSTADAISGIFQKFKNMQGNAGGCNLNACNLPQRNPITQLFLDIFKSFQNTFKNLVEILFSVALQPVGW